MVRQDSYSLWAVIAINDSYSSLLFRGCLPSRVRESGVSCRSEIENNWSVAFH